MQMLRHTVEHPLSNKFEAQRRYTNGWTIGAERFVTQTVHRALIKHMLRVGHATERVRITLQTPCAPDQRSLNVHAVLCTHATGVVRVFNLANLCTQRSLDYCTHGAVISRWHRGKNAQGRPFLSSFSL